MKRGFRLQQPAGFLGFDNSLLAIKYSFHSILWFCGCSTWTNYESVARLEGISIYLYIYATLMEINRVTQREHSRIYLHLCIWIYDLITPAQVSPFVHLSATHLLMAFVYSNLRKGQLDPIRIDWCNVCYCYMYIHISPSIADCSLLVIQVALKHLRTNKLSRFNHPSPVPQCCPKLSNGFEFRSIVNWIWDGVFGFQPQCPIWVRS